MLGYDARRCKSHAREFCERAQEIFAREIHARRVRSFSVRSITRSRRSSATRAPRQVFALACSPRDESDAIEGHFDTFCSGHSFSKGLKFPSGDVGGTSATTLRTSSGRGRKVRASHALEVGTLAHHAPRRTCTGTH